MAAVLIIAGGYVILTEDKQSDKKPAEPSGVKDDKPAEISENDSINQNDSGNNNIEENPYIENTTDTRIYGDIEKKITVTKRIDTFEGLKPTAKSQLNVGDTYIYHLSFQASPKSEIPCDLVEIDIPVHVEKIERINKTEYYVLKSERRDVYPVCYDTVNGKVEKIYRGKSNKPGVPDNPTPFGGCTIGINKDDPSDMNNTRLAENFAICEEVVNTQPNWVLYLDENTKFVQSTDAEIDGMKCTSTTETTVLGSEKMNGRDCFKVEKIRYSNCGTVNGKQLEMQVRNKQIYYIDKQKRITVKCEWYIVDQGNRFLMSSLELKEIKE
jgi:hypothetical protein